MMKALVLVARPLLLVIMVMMMLAGPAQALETCQAINAKAIGQDLGGGMTTAQIIGGGLLHGTTVGNFTITGISGTVASVEGTVTITTEGGTLSVNLKGTFDLAKGTFSTSGPVNSGASTGRFAGATGSLSLNGLEDLSSGRFVETITGTICLSGR